MKVSEIAKEINRLLDEGIEIHPGSPIHEKLRKSLAPKAARKRKEPVKNDFFEKWCEVIKNI